MEEKKEKSYKMKSLLLTILTRVVQIGIVIFLFQMVPVFFEFAEDIRKKPFDRYDRNGIFGTGMMPLLAIVPALLVVECVRLKLMIKLTGKTEEEYEKHLIERMPPEAVDRAKSYEANSPKLKAYLNSIKGEMGFTKDEVTYLFMMFIDVKKDKEREEAEKRRAEEEEKEKREEARREYGPSFSERIRKEAEETGKRPEDIKHNNPL